VPYQQAAWVLVAATASEGHQAGGRAIMRLARHCRGVDVSGRRKRPSSGAFRLALHFLWESGCRTKEMRDVAWGDVDLERGLIVMEKHKTFAKTGLPRLIPITRNIRRLLHVAASWQLRRGTQLTGPVFRGGRGKQWDKGTYGDQFRAYADMAGVRPNVTAYCLRHGFTVRGLEAGIGERQLADVLGHASTRYVSYYGLTTRTNADTCATSWRRSRPRARLDRRTLATRQRGTSATTG